MDELPPNDLYQKLSTIWSLACTRIILARSINANTGNHFLAS